jgi:hypothetical protein
MDKKSLGMVMREDKGTALVVVLVALLILTPLMLILSAMVLRWQQQAAELRDVMELEYVARSGWVSAANQLHMRNIDIPVGATATLELAELSEFATKAQISRDPDAILSLEGRVLVGLDSRKVDLDATAIDPDYRRVRRFRRLEVYLVDIFITQRPSIPGVRLRGILIRTDDGEVRQIGLRVDREYGGSTQEFKNSRTQE